MNGICGNDIHFSEAIPEGSLKIAQRFNVGERREKGEFRRNG